MKKNLLLLLVIGLQVNVFAHNQILEAYNATPNSSYPYSGTREKTSSINHWFPYDVWSNGVLNDKVCKDIGLLAPEAPDEDGWMDCALTRTFNPTNGDYKLCVITMGTFDYGKTMLISIDNKGNYIDAIQVEAWMSVRPDGLFAVPMQWQIESNMQVSVYQLKLTENKIYEFDQEIPFPLQAQRIDQIYQITPDGKFSLIKTIRYKPGGYSYLQYVDSSCDIWKGREMKE